MTSSDFDRNALLRRLESLSEGLSCLRKSISLLELDAVQKLSLEAVCGAQDEVRNQILDLLDRDRQKVEQDVLRVERRRKRERREDVAVGHKKSGFTTFRKRAPGSYGSGQS